jgi:L-ascorbate metabolism protein UlaG (beta-lactamase superfamily)
MSTASITWLGHSTVLVEMAGTRVLTDPLLRPRVGHLTRRAPAPDQAMLERLDAVLLSHVHRDHLDRPSLRRLPADVPLIGPPGTRRFVPGRREVHELLEDATVEVGGMTVRAVPAVHEVRRAWRSLPAVGFLLDGERRVYFAGDTELFGQMSELAALDLALLPVWGWGPTLGPGHLNPRSAAEALTLLRPRRAVGIHWGTYFPAWAGRGGHRALEAPPREFARHAAERAPDVDVAVLRPGERLDLVEESTP